MSDALLTNVDERLLRKTKFPPEFQKKVDMNKINIPLIKNWINSEIARIQQSDDDVVAELVSTLLESERFPNIKKLQINLTGFLDKDAAPFCESLWKLCLSAQENPQGIPKELIEAKKAELSQEKAEKEKAREEAIKRQEAERERERDLTRMRDRERNDRRGRGGRNGRDFDRRPFRDSRSRSRSRSPAFRRRRDDDDFDRVRSRADTYVPNRSRSPPPRRRRRDSSSSRSPPPRRQRRNTSSERSLSPRDRRESYDRRRRRSPSPRRRSSPPSKRARRASPPPVRRPSTSDSKSSAQSGASQQQSKTRRSSELSPDDLMSTSRRGRLSQPDGGRLSRVESTSSNPTDGELAPLNPQPLPANNANLAREAMLKSILINRRKQTLLQTNGK